MAASPRTPWQPAFPDVVVHTDLALRDRHPLFDAAKGGDREAALTLAQDLLSPAATQTLSAMIQGRPALLLPTSAIETAGFNAIPDAMAHVLARELDLGVHAGEIVQSNRVGHTRAKSYNRLVTPAAFEGAVIAGANYVLVDDHVGLGGTLANLKGYVETEGAAVIAVTTLTESSDARHIALNLETLAVLRERHGYALQSFWIEQFGHGLECLTEREGRLLCREPSLIAIRDRLAQAAIEARSRGFEPAIELDDH